jgi:hypothetical protein
MYLLLQLIFLNILYVIIDFYSIFPTNYFFSLLLFFLNLFFLSIPLNIFIISVVAHSHLLILNIYFIINYMYDIMYYTFNYLTQFFQLFY